ncbi:DUF1998 domain-containing protein [Streptomyces sp. ZYX-F-203]
MPIAGEEARLDPFRVRTSCGDATADGSPVVEVARDRVRRDRRPGFGSPLAVVPAPPDPRRLGEHGRSAGRDVPVPPAHELTTVAVRVLLPASVARFKERPASFTAAHFTGIAARYGGDPDHIDIAEATVPADAGDPETGWPRRFPAVYDRLPGGTGYLRRPAAASGFREVQLRARVVIERCPCQEKGMDGCHHCLLRRVPAADYDRISRNEVRRAGVPGTRQRGRLLARRAQSLPGASWARTDSGEG